MQRVGAIAVALVATLASSPTSARETALILSFVGRGGADLAPYIKPVADAMPQLHPKWDVELRRQADQTFGDPLRTLETEKLEAIKAHTDRIEQGILLGELNPNVGIQQLEGYRKTLAEAPGSLGLDPQARDLYFRVLLLLSNAYAIKDHPSPLQASARMAELVASFPELPAGATLAPSMRDLYERTKATMDKRRRVTIRVDRSTAPGAKMFINGRPAWCSSATAVVCSQRIAADGTYPVFAATASGDGRMHRVGVGDLDVTINVDIPFEVALTTERYVGFHYATAQARNEARFVERFGREMDFKTVLVLSQFSEGNAAGVRLKAYEIGTGSVVISSSVGMLGGVLTPTQISELTRRVVEKFGAPSAATASAKTAPTPVLDANAAQERRAQLKRQVETAYLASACGDAAKLIDQWMAAGGDHQEVLRMKAATLCCLHDRAGALATLRELDEAGRNYAIYICQKHGVVVP